MVQPVGWAHLARPVAPRFARSMYENNSLGAVGPKLRRFRLRESIPLSAPRGLARGIHPHRCQALAP